MKNEIEKIINTELETDNKDYYYLKLDKWIIVPDEKKLETYKFCRENKIEVSIDENKKNKLFRKKELYPFGYNPYQE